MKSFKYHYLLLLLILFSDTFSGKSYQGFKLLIFKLETQEQVDYLNKWADQNFDDVSFFLYPNIQDDTEIAVSSNASKRLLSLLRSFNIKHEIVNANLGDTIDKVNEENERCKEIKRMASPYSTSLDIVGCYATHDQIRAWLKSLVDTYSQLTEIITIGKSYEEKPIEVLRIKTGSENKPILFIDAGIHAREWLAPASLIYFIDALVKGTGNEKVRKILDKYEVHALPVVNPDGYNYTFGGDGNRLWRKTRRLIRKDCYGVDANRNFDAFFGTTGVSKSCTSDIYPGEHPFSEIEVRFLADYLLKIQSRTKLYLALHTFGELWLTPFGYSKNAIYHNKEESDRVANLAASALKEVNGTVFRVDPPYKVLYEASGGAYDWVLLKTSIPYAYTLELRPSKANQPTVAPKSGHISSVAEIKPSGEELFAAVVSMAENMK